MTTARWLRDLVKDEWGVGEDSTSISMPEVIEEGTEDRRSVHRRQNDVIFAMDGGLPTVDPQSLGYREEYIESTVDLEMITSESREHLLGPPDETYAGIEGEVKRILDKYRIGYPADGELPYPGYDIIRIDTFDDAIGNYGADFWAGIWTVTFITYASQIGQDAANRA